ncbi:MAG: hypothetical protein KTQ12_05930 [Dermatophilaceae bacterium]|nr:hypothetical protein [Dermatophilaceae bacterium]
MVDTRVLVYGSCVARDMVEFLGPGFQLVGYSARQSMISAMSPPVGLPTEPNLSSPFQARMVTDDFGSSVAERIRSAGADVDLLVLDLVDERLGVLALPGGRYLTRSQELIESGLLVHLPPAAPHIRFGTNDHLLLWRAAARGFVELLRTTGLLERTLVVEATFASTTDKGTPATRWRGESASVWNERYRPYYDSLVSTGMRTHVIGARAIAASDHHWGPSAYHYVDDVYRAIAETVHAMAKPSG